MWTALFWAYLANAVLLTTHEIDSAYWREWDLFHLPGGLGGFLIIHLAILGPVFYGVYWVGTQSFAGIVMSFVLAGAGFFAAGIHMFFLARGHGEFRHPVSITILIATAAVSAVQAVTAALLLGG